MFKYPLAVTIGYLNFNEDGGASDGIDEDIEYEFDEILKEIDSYISEQDSIVEAEAKIVKINYTNISNFAKVSIQVVTSKVAFPSFNQLR